jgi:hypothetical protein
VFCALSNGASGMRVEPADSFGSVAAWVAAVSWGVRCLAADEVDERACGGWGGALAAPDERYGETNGGVQAAYFEGRPVEGSDRPGEDRGGEAAGGERSQKEGVAAFEGEAEWLAGGGEELVQDERDGRAAPGRDDRALGEVGDGDVGGGGGAFGSEAGDYFVVAQVLDGEFVGGVAGEEAEGGVEVVGGETAVHVGGDALAQAGLDAGVSLAEACEQSGDVEVACGVERADPDVATQDAAELVDLLACAVQFGEDAAGSGGDHLSGLGGGDPSARALEQGCAEFSFELSDLVRERRLGDVELFGRAGEMAVTGDRFDALELPKLHANDRRTRLLH